MVAVKPGFPDFELGRLLRKYRTEERRQRIAPLYERMLSEAESLAEVAAVYEEFPRDELGPTFAEPLPDRTAAVVLCVCTLGQKLDKHLAELFWHDAAGATVLDEICLVMISSVAREIRESLKEGAQRRGLKVGPPYRPGLGRWPLEAQRTIFEKLPAHQIGVEMSDHLLMTPLKTTSLIIPLIDKQ